MSKENPTILLAEDSEYIVPMIVQEFSKAGITNLIIAKSGEEIVPKFKEHKPDAIVLDIVMPGELGIDALKEIRALEEGKDVAVIIISNHSDPMYKEQAEKLGVKAYLMKPSIVLGDIVEATRKAIG